MRLDLGELNFRKRLFNARLVHASASNACSGEAPVHSRPHRHALRLIAALKTIEATLLVAAGVAALGLLEASWQETLFRWLNELSLQAGRRLTSHLAAQAIALLGMPTPAHLAFVAIGCFAYAGVFLLEALGLWLRQRWGSYLTSISTASLLPFETLELLRHPSAQRAAILLVNLLVVAYLTWSLVVHRSRSTSLDASGRPRMIDKPSP